MPLKLITGPAVDLLTLAELRLHLKLDADGSPESHPDDDLVSAIGDTVRATLDGRDGWLGRALTTQTWDFYLDRFPPAEIRVPLPPLQSVTSITYTDTDAAQQTLSSSLYTVDTVSQPGWIVPGTAGWPSTYDTINAVIVRFVAGYGDTAADVPAPIRQAAKLMAGDLYENRQNTVVGLQAMELPAAAASLLMPYRVWAV